MLLHLSRRAVLSCSRPRLVCFPLQQALLPRLIRPMSTRSRRRRGKAKKKSSAAEASDKKADEVSDKKADEASDKKADEASNKKTDKVSNKKADKRSNKRANKASNKKDVEADSVVEKTYQRKSPREHILLRPEVYLGSNVCEERALWVWDAAQQSIVQRLVKYVPALYKIFDEILVNAADNLQRAIAMQKKGKKRQKRQKMTYLKVNIDKNPDGFIVIENDGPALPVVMHSSEKMYVPELVFGNLLTSSNYDDKEKRFTGGRHGYGAKLTNIFSRKFLVDVFDAPRSLQYKQVFSDNMSSRTDPEVTKRKPKSDERSWTRISFQPDYQRFGMTRLTFDMLALMRRRVLDVNACNPSLRVELDDHPVDVKSFSQYMLKHSGVNKGDCVEEVINKQWTIGLCHSTTGVFAQTSFVNGIATLRGGKHVDAIASQICKHIAAMAEKRNRDIRVSAGRVKDFLHLFVNCQIPNPSFESQTKECLTSLPASFDSNYTISLIALNRIANGTGVVEKVIDAARVKQTKQLQRTDGKKKTRVSVLKLDDANKAGGSKASKCTLILTEGDSAKALAVSGLSIVGRDYYGVFPLRGKLLNVRDAKHDLIMRNEEVGNIKKILGLQTGQKYHNASKLRYGHIMIMADQDHDGSHVKGLIVNLLDVYWPELLRVPGFLKQFITPIVKCSKKSEKTLSFFTLPEFEAWKKKTDTSSWRIKYFKGLGTSSSSEAKDYFRDLARHSINFHTSRDDGALIDLAFNRQRSDDRKDWLGKFKLGTHINYHGGSVSISDFINRELILFSMYDNVRSIPSIVDGLKPGQRKILFACFKRKLVSEIKVAQLAGYTAEHTAYHHGEDSLNKTIVNLAQNFLGSNNTNLLLPNGQFGTRHQAGQDSASPRYIYTQLSPIARALFPPVDDPLLNQLEDDGMKVEPEWYVPVAPLVLFNGSEGIGTGWSTHVPNYNPKEVIDYLRYLIHEKEGGKHGEGKGKPAALKPWYKNFRGTIQPSSKPNIFTVSGVIKWKGKKTLEVTELPMRRSTEQYKAFLDTLCEDGLVRSYEARHTDTKVHFVIDLTAQGVERYSAGSDECLLAQMRLQSPLALTNMVLFSADGILTRYKSAEDILSDFFNIRFQFYDKRRKSLEHSLAVELSELQNKMSFVEAVTSRRLRIMNRPQGNIIKEMFSMKICKTEEEAKTLLSMSILSLSKDRLDRLRQERKAKQKELNHVKNTSSGRMWLHDLDELEEAIRTHEAVEEEDARPQVKTKSKPKKKKKTKGKTKSKAK